MDGSVEVDMDSPTRHLGAHSAPRDVRPSSPTSEHLDSDTEDQDPPRHARIAPARVIANSPRPHTTNARSFYHSYRHGGDTGRLFCHSFCNRVHRN